MRSFPIQGGIHGQKGRLPGAGSAHLGMEASGAALPEAGVMQDAARGI